MLEAKQIAGLLNQLFDIDPVAAAKLVDHRVECSDAFLIGDIPFVCSRNSKGVVTMGVVGFVNALAIHGTGCAAAIYDDNNQLIGFTVVGDD